MASVCTLLPGGSPFRNKFVKLAATRWVEYCRDVKARLTIKQLNNKYKRCMRVLSAIRMLQRDKEVCEHCFSTRVGRDGQCCTHYNNIV